jgi:CBS domain-containing protein
MRVADVLSAKGANVLSVRADKTLAAAINLMAVSKIGSIVVVDASNRPLGIVSEPDIVAAISTNGGACLTQDVRQALRAPPPKCGPEESVGAALARMTRDRVRYLLVVESERLLGLVSIGDLVKARLETTELESRVLRDMARGAVLAQA